MYAAMRALVNMLRKQNMPHATYPTAIHSLVSHQSNVSEYIESGELIWGRGGF